MIKVKNIPLNFLIQCIFIFFSHCALAATKVDSAKENLNAVHEKIDQLKRELSGTQKAQEDATDQLKKSEKQISDTNRSLYEISVQQKKNYTKLQELKAQSDTVESQVDLQRKMLEQQIYQQYLHGDPGYLQMIIQSENPSVVARNIQYYSYVAKARAKNIYQMQGNLKKIEAYSLETASKLKEIASLKQKEEIKRAELESQKKDRARLIASLSSKINQQRNEIQKLMRDEKRLTDLVDRLTRLPSTPIPSKREEKSSTKTPVLSNESIPTETFSGQKFESLRGKLSLPVKGDVINRFGSPREDTGLSWKGLFIKSNEGNEVKSIATGRVVFADWLRGFGNLIIVDHGEGYMSLYGNNQSTLKKTGEIVRGGDVIALVGNTGGNESNGLYFELRKLSKPFDPLAWTAIK
jgi:septal ring factor EnvC (AmiA/AmiB activator)